MQNKKYKNTKCIFVVFILFFCNFYKQNTKHTEKNNYIIRMQFLKNAKYKKKNVPKKKQNTKYKKKEPKISKIQNTKKKKCEFQNEPESQPHVHFEKQEPTCKINAKPTCYPAIQILYFWVVFFSVFLGIFNSLQKTLL